MKIITQKYQQNNQLFYSTVLPFSIIDSCSEVLIYGKDKYGYQRDIDSKHSNSIKVSILKENEFLPTSIILSVNKEDIEKYIHPLVKESDENVEFKNTFTEIFELDLPDSKIFRVVDGQHRLSGLREAQKEKIAKGMEDNISNFPLSVIILPIDSKERVKEVITFRDINSKAKKLKTDLTLLAMYNYELLNKKELKAEVDLLKHLIIRTTQKLNENKESVWYNAIQFDIHERPLEGVIGVAPMVNALRNIVKKYIEFKGIDFRDLNRLTDDEKISELNSISKEIENLVTDVWDAVAIRWKNCFVSRNSSNFVSHYYLKNCYIQKTAGVNAIHMILLDTLEYNDDSFNLSAFIEKIRLSSLKDEEWMMGGPFSGLTSQTGFKVAKNLITIN